MNLCTTRLLAATSLVLSVALSTVVTLADPQSTDGGSENSWAVAEDALGTPLGLIESDDTRTVDGTGLRAISAPGTETVDGTGLLRGASNHDIDTVDGTGLRNSLGSASTETVDGTGQLRSISPSSTDSDTIEAELDEPGE